MYRHIPPASLNVLKALSHLHYLSNKHLVELGLASSEHSLNAHALRSLLPPRTRKARAKDEDAPKRKPKDSYRYHYCGSVRYGNEELKGFHQLPDIHYMTAKGREYLYWKCADELDDDEDIWIPAPNKTRTNDYFHLTQYVYAHMYLRRLCDHRGWVIERDSHYYQGLATGERGKPVSQNTVIWEQKGEKQITPDGLFVINMDGKRRLFALEMTRHTQTGDALKQLYKYLRALPSIKAKFLDADLHADPFVLSVHHDNSVFRNLKKRVAAHDAFKPAIGGVMFAELNDMKPGTGDAWTLADGSPAPVFAE